MAVTKIKLKSVDGVTATVAELNILDGVTSTAAEINLLDGVTRTTTEINNSNKSAIGLFEHSATISSNYSISSGYNAISGGPVSIDNGVTVTIPSGSTWTVA